MIGQQAIIAGRISSSERYRGKRDGPRNDRLTRAAWDRRTRSQEESARSDCTGSRQKGRGRARRWWLFCLWEVDCAVWFLRASVVVSVCPMELARSRSGSGSRSRALGYVTRTAGVSSARASRADSMTHSRPGLDPAVSAGTSRASVHSR